MGGERRRGRYKGPVPHYWWDFHWVNGDIASVRVETDDPEYPDGVRDFPLLSKIGPADREIAAAEAFIADLQTGRKSAGSSHAR